jgi:hypothetical protein
VKLQIFCTFLWLAAQGYLRCESMNYSRFGLGCAGWLAVIVALSFGVAKIFRNFVRLYVVKFNL